MRALGLALAALTVAVMTAGFLATTSCTSGTTPDCDDGACGQAPTEAGAPVEAAPQESGQNG